MIDATRLCGVVGDCATGAAEFVIEADAGREGEQAGRDSCEQVARRARSVAFEGEQVLAGAEDRLDALPDGRQMDAVVWLGAASGAHDLGSQCRDLGRELAAGVALVTDDRLSSAEGLREDRESDLALGPVGADERGARGVPSGAQTRCRRMPQK
jgi:hypothetical protein